MLKKILLIDDDPVIIKMLETRLKANQYDVLSASEAANGLELAMKKSPDLIILDVMMPIINGYNMCQLLKAEETSRDIPIVMLTSRSEAKDKEIGQKAGADAYITKPFDMEKLIAEIERLLKR